MSKELPWFRFTVSEWMNDDICMESYKTKGVFIDLCSFYWFKDCNVDLKTIEKRFSNAKATIKRLLDAEIIKVDDNQNVTILFLDEQYDLLSEKRIKRQKAGRIGGKQKSSNAKAMLKQCSSYKDKDNNKDNNKDKISIRSAFIQNVKNECELLNIDEYILNEFCDYWTEIDYESGLMQYQTKENFGIKSRLKGWLKNSDKEKSINYDIK